MKPFSALKFFAENKRKGLMTFVVLILSVCAISLITVLINSIYETCNNTILSPLKSFSVVYPQSGEYYLNDQAITKLKADDNIDRLLPADFGNTSINLAIGGNTSVPVVFMAKSDNKFLLDRLGDKISKGRMPEDNTNEIAVQWQVMANKGWKLGQTVGSSQDSDEWLSGSHKIVGVIDGPNIAIVGTRSNRQEQYKKNGLSLTKPIGYTVVPKEGKLSQMNKTLDSIKKKASIETYDIDKKMLDKAIGGLQSTMTAIIIIVVMILSISVAALTYLIYLQRSEEFGILTAMGYRRAFIRRLIIKEVMSLDLISWAVGMVAAYFVVMLLNKFVYNPSGNIINFLSPNVFYYTLIIPLMVGFFSILPIVVKLHRWDAITIIERRE